MIYIMINKITLINLQTEIGTFFERYRWKQDFWAVCACCQGLKREKKKRRKGEKCREKKGRRDRGRKRKESEQEEAKKNRKERRTDRRKKRFGG